jgi:SNF2 family DNA or RNA helicase
MRTLAWLTKLRQLACHPRLVDRSWLKSSSKLELFLEIAA